MGIYEWKGTYLLVPTVTCWNVIWHCVISLETNVNINDTC